ncbi:MAG: AbrB/MazE/SpoVT family DNA-binding domain-containing protein [Euryarchaeota archaeon]|nr:AbrB/MazE/SpoVT family DNA-binding domain-containing protein [Euryarchaeota archaeon]MBU4138581.1 AbrB/MazE/SpoVT family DNA-binding domain-containing protein [Euryarchaeota archaeon]
MNKNNFKFKSRRIQRNVYTYWMSLPPEWLMNMNLRKGSEVTVEMIEDGSLLIKPSMETPAVPAKEATGAANSPEKESQHVSDILGRP